MVRRSPKSHQVNVKHVSYNNCSAKSNKLPQILDHNFGDDLHPKHKV